MMKATPNFVVPETLEELQARVLAEDPPCTCDKCDPGSYNNCESIHETIDTSQREENRFGQACIPAHGLQTEWETYEARHLAYHCIQYFDREVEQLNELQIKAINRFNRYRDSWMHRLNWADGPRAVGKRMMEKLLQVINDLFFFGDLPKMEFIWDRESGDDQLGICLSYSGTGVVEIYMHSTAYNTWFPQRGSNDTSINNPHARLFDRISTLLHEALHAYLNTGSCTSCPTFDANVHSGGHGVAWSLVAAKLEVAASRLLRIPVHLGRFEAMRGHITRTEKLPSQCNLAECNLA